MQNQNHDNDNNETRSDGAQLCPSKGLHSNNYGGIEANGKDKSSSFLEEGKKVSDENTENLSRTTTNALPIISIARHSISTAAMCMCSLVHAYLLISVFPYAGYMVIDLIDDVTEENAGTYAGLIASSFMAGRTLSSYHWGKLADVYGRVFVLNASLVLSAIFSVLFGMSPTFRYAMIWRFCLGFSNGIIGTAKTAVTELAHGDERLERRAMGLVIGMRGWGFLISPALGGWLAEPAKQYPNASWIVNSPQGVQSMLLKYPFLLPNLVGAIVCFLIVVVVTCFIEETLPASKRRSPKYIPHDTKRQIDLTLCQLHSRTKMMLLTCFGKNKNPQPSQHQSDETTSLILVKHDEVAENNNGNIMYVSQSTENTDASESSLWNRKDTRRHLWAYWIFSFVVVAVDEAFPLFCISKAGGLGLSEATIGKILSASGLLFALGQYAVFASITHHFGLYPAITIGSVLGVPPVALIPLSLVLNNQTTGANGVSSWSAGVTWSAFLFLSVLMSIMKIFSCLFFTSIAIAANKTVPSSQRAKMNGLNMVGGSIAKGLGPTFAGALVAVSVTSTPQYGSVIIFTVIALFGLVVVAEAQTLAPSTGNNEDEEDNTENEKTID